jgi:hypothetical protein
VQDHIPVPKASTNASSSASIYDISIPTTTHSGAALPRSTESAADVDKGNTNHGKVFATPAQDVLKGKRAVILTDIASLACRESLNALTDEERKKKSKLQTELKEVETAIKRRQSEQERQQKSRATKKMKLEELCMTNPDLKKQLNVRDKPGRPALTDDQPDLLKTIVDIATYGCGADERRQTETIRSIKTLEELTAAVQGVGFTISRSSVYLHLIPKRADTREGKRHVKTVPVKLAKAQADGHKKHIDTMFACATIKNMEELASVLGPQEVCFISQDDKARVPIGITAANKQAPLLMHLEYRVTLPDHDWVVASGHKLIPSVYAGIIISENNIGNSRAVSYSGPTFIAIRSGKHSSSTALSHALDFGQLLEKPEFDVVTKTHHGHIKPIMMLTVDGGPDENPRYVKVINVAIHHFKKYDFDAFFVATNAPGRSAFNRVERRMAPLSRELAGLILPHEHFGSHLDGKGQTVNDDLEKSNFAFAGKTLAEVWGSTVIDGYPVIAHYVNPESSEISEDELISGTPLWLSNHVRESQYFTQIVKCKDIQCCRAPRSSYFQLISQRFLPPPLPLMQTAEGLRVAELGNAADGKFVSLFITQTLDSTLLPRSALSFKMLPYDAYCPSVQAMINRRICKKCGLYHASLTSLKAHQCLCGVQQLVPRIRPMRIAARRQRELLAIIVQNEAEDAEWIDEDDVDTEGMNIPNQFSIRSCTVPLIDIRDHLNNIWL